MLQKLLSGLVAFGAVAIGAHAQPEPLTAQDFARHPLISSPSMSLEGDMMVAVITDPSDPSKRAAAYWDLTGDLDLSKPIPPSNVTPTSGKTLFFAAAALKQRKSLWFTVQPYVGALMGCGEGKTTGSTKKYLQRVYMGNERIRKIDDLPDGRAEVGANRMILRCFELVGETGIESLLPLDPENIVISRATTSNGTSYFKHNLRTGREEFLYKADNTDSFQISSRDGMPVARTELEFEDGEWVQYIKLKAPGSDEFTIEDPLTTQIRNRYNMSIFGYDEASGNYYIGTDKFSDKVSVYLYDAGTDTFSDAPILAHPDYNITSLITSSRPEDFGSILGFRFEGPSVETYWLDPEMKSIQDALNAAYPGKTVNLIDYTNDRNRVLYSVSAANYPPVYGLLFDKARVGLIGAARPWIREEQLGRPEFVYYEARDGLQIPALITLPTGYEPGQKARGAIIHPHGGPWARDYQGWGDAGWTQYFANRGFIVLQPQYRGSTGWGRELWVAGDGEWGQKMQDDKDDAAAWLVENGYVDADKIAIHGYSYGGFAAIAASVRPESPYQCAIAGAGVANLTKLSNSWGSNRIQRIFQGNTVDGMDPQDNTRRVNIPIQLYHGDYDVRVPLWHSRDFYNEIRGDQPQSELIVLREMGHQSNKWQPEHKETVLVEMERFLTDVCGM